MINKHYINVSYELCGVHKRDVNRVANMCCIMQRKHSRIKITTGPVNSYETTRQYLGATELNTAGRRAKI